MEIAVAHLSAVGSNFNPVKQMASSLALQKHPYQHHAHVCQLAGSMRSSNTLSDKKTMQRVARSSLQCKCCKKQLGQAQATPAAKSYSDDIGGMDSIRNTDFNMKIRTIALPHHSTPANVKSAAVKWTTVESCLIDDIGWQTASSLVVTAET